MSTTTLNDNGSKTLTLRLLSAAGNPVTPRTSPTWSSSDPAIVAVAPAADGLSAVLSATGRLGGSTVTATYNGLNATTNVQVIAGDAASIGFVDQPDTGTAPATPPAAGGTGR